jgi:hypothetical protein
MKSVARRVSDAAMLRLVKTWLEMAVEETDERRNKRVIRVEQRKGPRGRLWHHESKRNSSSVI